MSDWVEALYDELLAEVLLRREPEAAELAFLVRELALGEGVRVFDQGCGVGSLAIALARWGVSVVGLDQSAAYVDEARQAAAGLHAEFHVGDARSFTPAEPVQGAFSWWTSWGHAPDDAGNLAMLARARQALAPGGVFALDTMNVAGVLRGFQAETILTREVARLGGPVQLRRTSEVDLQAGVLHKTWTYDLPDGQVVTHPSAMRLYLPWQVADMLRQAGFEGVRLLGSVAGEPLALDSGRLIALARAPL